MSDFVPRGDEQPKAPLNEEPIGGAAERRGPRAGRVGGPRPLGKRPVGGVGGGRGDCNLKLLVYIAAKFETFLVTRNGAEVSLRYGEHNISSLIFSVDNYYQH